MTWKTHHSLIVYLYMIHLKHSMIYLQPFIPVSKCCNFEDLRVIAIGFD